MRRLYNGVTKFLDTNFLGLLIGLETGVLINIATGQKDLNSDYWLSIAWLVGATICLFVLARWRLQMDSEVERFKELNMPSADRWKSSNFYDEKLVRYGYWLFLLLAIAGTVFGAVQIRDGNIAELKDERSSQINLDSRLKNVIMLEKQLLQEIKKITYPVKSAKIDSSLNKSEIKRSERPIPEVLPEKKIDSTSSPKATKTKPLSE